jgi:hypothetical protein
MQPRESREQGSAFRMRNKRGLRTGIRQPLRRVRSTEAPLGENDGKCAYAVFIEAVEAMRPATLPNEPFDSRPPNRTGSRSQVLASRRASIFDATGRRFCTQGVRL